MISSRTEYDNLVELLNKASEAYYNSKEIMSNKEFDALMDELNAYERKEGIVRIDSPSHTVGAAAVDFLPKFTHPYPALSLDKTKDVKEFVRKFEDGINNSGDETNDGVVLMWKEDGSTIQAYYNDGKLQHLVTRGNGEIGSDITHNASAIEGVPLTIPHAGEVVVRGEALMSYDDFDIINSALPEDRQYKNPRNLAAASIQMLDPKEVEERHIVVKAFNLVKIDSEIDSFNSRLNMLKNMGFDVVERWVGPVCDLESAIETMSGQVENYPYPVDGLVAVMDNYKYAINLTGTEHHPHIMNGYAFKWSDETAETVLREIEWSPSRTGLLNPVAIFDPVELEGTTVKRASLHNVSIIANMKLHVGNRISVYKSNKIIPYVDQNLDYENERSYTSKELYDLAGVCPTCNAKVMINRSDEGILTAYCPNEECPEKLIGKLVHFCARDCMNIEGMSEETIKKLVDNRFVKEYKDFFNLNNQIAISMLPGFGKISWRKMCDAAEKARTTDFVRFVTSLSIPNIGKGQAKTLLKHLSSHYDELCNISGYSLDNPYNPFMLLVNLVDVRYDFSTIDGFGPVIACDLTNWISSKFNGTSSAESRLVNSIIFSDVRPTCSPVTSSISGRSFCITGKLIKFNNRQELVDLIESRGGKWVDSVSSKTDYLINNDVDSTSGKNKKAKELGIPVISEDDFIKLIDN